MCPGTGVDTLSSVPVNIRAIRVNEPAKGLSYGLKPNAHEEGRGQKAGNCGVKSSPMTSKGN
jgi:hypothetical protein